VLFGAITFLAMLWFIGTGQTGRGENDGSAHASAKGLNGYAALARLLEDDGLMVTLSRNKGGHDTTDLLVLTPPHYSDHEELQGILEARRYSGPTLVILPKWYASEVPKVPGVEAEQGWVTLSGADAPSWPLDFDEPYRFEAADAELKGAAPHWRGLGYAGRLPDPKSVVQIGESDLIPLVSDRSGRALVGYVNDQGWYPVLDDAAGRTVSDSESRDQDRWGVVFVAEPDLLNNYGMADRARADLARDLIRLAMEGEELGVTFDLTLNGIGQTQNLLTLAFTPPFLAATLCLLLAMLVVGWRAFRRFGPAVQEDREIAFGKARLIANSAGFIQRTGRLHLLAAPFAALVAARVAHLLRLRGADEPGIDEALRRRGHDGPAFSTLAGQLRAARSRPELLRTARALKDIERNLTP
jgi:hypothetical protein